MAQTPEGKVKKFIDDFMKQEFPDAWRYCPPGGMFGRAGVADRLYLWQGVFISIEAKDNGKNPTELQLRDLILVRDNGGIAAVVRGKDMQKMLAIKAAILAKHAQIRGDNDERITSSN